MLNWTAQGIVTEVIDGDTVKAELDLGWKVFIKVTIRITGINCPELKTEYGPAAKGHTESLVPAGTRINVLSHGLDKYGRTLASVRLPDGSDLASKILEAGHAVQYFGFVYEDDTGAI